jgi:hypothetical protein
VNECDGRRTCSAIKGAHPVYSLPQQHTFVQVIVALGVAVTEQSNNSGLPTIIDGDRLVVSTKRGGSDQSLRYK